MNKVFYLLIMASLLPVLIFAYPAMTVTATNGGVVVLSDLYNITIASSGCF
jgi:hypothetical protein